MARGERGSAMTITMVVLTISLFALMLSFERLHEAMQIEEARMRVPSSSDGTAEALGRAVARMHTGVPSESPYTCRSRLRSSDGDDVLAFRITHTQVSADRWLVSAEASAAEDPDCPSSFEDTCPLEAP
jgi:hypothetical protein